jgi:hypothetical protein
MKILYCKLKNLLILLIILLILIVNIIIIMINNIKSINFKLYHELCNQYPNDLIKQLKEKSINLTLKQIEQNLNLTNKQTNNNNNKLAIIVPYRNRKLNLKIFLNYIHEFLRKQNNNNYDIFIIEPNQDNIKLVFNRALLLNIGYLEALKYNSAYNCFIFHDVDMLPENMENIYDCNFNYPKQMAISISIFNYSQDNYFKNEYMGGVTAYTKEQYYEMNGYSNLFYGWGGEGKLYSILITRGYIWQKRLRATFFKNDSYSTNEIELKKKIS